MNPSRSRHRRNFLATAASICIACAAGCASHPGPTDVMLPPNPLPPSQSSVRDPDDLASMPMSAPGAPTIDAKKLAQTDTSRGFDFGDNGAAAGGPLSLDQIGQLLASFNLRPEMQGRAYIFNVSEDDLGFTHPFVVTLSRDGYVIFFLAPICDVNPQGWSNQDAMLKLMLANFSICPASFAIGGQKLFLVMGVPNIGVTDGTMKTALSYLDQMFRNSRPLWGPWISQTTGGGSPIPAPENPLGGPSGGEPAPAPPTPAPSPAPAPAPANPFQ